jgi:predicted amidohydrolase YtcJ
LIYHPYLMELEESGWKAGEGDDWFRIGALKIFADGSIGGRTALLSEPYADDPGNVGLAIHEEEELGELATQAVKRGMPIAVHAIGDAAVERVLRVMADHPLKPGNPSRLRHRLIHAQFLRPDLIERLKRLEVVVDIQPRFVASDFPWVLKRVGMKRAPYAYTWKTLWDAGVQVAGGSDAPIEPFHPLLGIHAAVTRRRLDDPKEHPGYGPEQKLTPIQALHLFTKGSAYAAGEERERGTLSVGKFADLTVYERDILTVEPDELDRVQTLFTVVNGRIGYRA